MLLLNFFITNICDKTLVFFKKTNFIWFFLDIFNINLFVFNVVISVLLIIMFFNKIKIFSKKIIITTLVMVTSLFIFFFTNSIYIFFLSYEFFLLPSAYLVFLSSPNLRSKIITFYFLLWTQLGSFLFFISIIVLHNNSSNFYFYNFFFSRSDCIVSALLFIGFGIKIPIYPFSFWLTKTHVEVNTPMSIFLSGVLVKTALYGIYKFIYIFNNLNIFLLIVAISVLDSSIKLFSQVDLKKVIAYCTIYEMNFILFNMLFFNHNTVIYVLYFCILHSSLSFLFFFISDIIYKRQSTRSIINIGGLYNNYKLITAVIFISTLLMNGLPLTLKFNLELFFFSRLANFNPLYFMIFFLSQIFFLVFFNKIMYTVTFNNSHKRITTDLSMYEFIFILICMSFIII